MQIENKSKITIALKATYKQPYPIAHNEYRVNGRKADLVAITDKVNLIIDDKNYEGYHAYILFNIG